MSFNPDYRPRLADLNWLGRSDEELGSGLTLEAASRGPRTTDPSELADRAGYDAAFLGAFAVPWPKLRDKRANDVLLTSGGKDRLDYLHFSVTMSIERRMAALVGVNIDGAATVRIERTQDKWSLDGRILPEQQIGEALYANNGLNRGHLVRREDPNWGPEAKKANDDTFHFTNCAPQMAGFNQKTWLSLESYVLGNTRRWAERVTVFSGPVFREDDRLYRDVHIPLSFWKVIAFLSDDGRPSATAYLIEQDQELLGLEAAFGAFKTYQVSVRHIEDLTKVDFGLLAAFDGFSNEEEATGARIETLLRSHTDMRV